MNYKIIGYGASHSTGILVHHMAISKYLDYLVDENKVKVNKYMPGTDLKVFDAAKIEHDQKLVIVVLAWQYYDQIRLKLINNNFPGIIIKPVLP